MSTAVIGDLERPVYKCSVCGDLSTKKCGNQRVCDKHYRFGQMRWAAKRNGKAVPTRDQLESMSGSSLICPDCGTQMNWRIKDGGHTVATLQHYRDGSMNIVCMSCNTRHASMPGDSYRQMEKDHKLCPCCQQIKPLTEYTVDNSRSGAAKRKSKCRQCADATVNQWKDENRDRYNEYQRQYRAKRKAEGRPVKGGVLNRASAPSI